jgi:uncharacterized protein
MIRLLILGLLGYGLYRALKSLRIASGDARAPRSGKTKPREVDDVLIQDPVCKAYFARRTGVHLHRRGQDIYFCSEACRDRYLAENGRPESDRQ